MVLANLSMSCISCPAIVAPCSTMVCLPSSYSTNANWRLGRWPPVEGKSANTWSPSCKAATASATGATAYAPIHRFLAVSTLPHCTCVMRPSGSRPSLDTAYTPWTLRHEEKRDRVFLVWGSSPSMAMSCRLARSAGTTPGRWVSATVSLPFERPTTSRVWSDRCCGVAKVRTSLARHRAGRPSRRQWAPRLGLPHRNLNWSRLRSTVHALQTLRRPSGFWTPKRTAFSRSVLAVTVRVGMSWLDGGGCLSRCMYAVQHLGTCEGGGAGDGVDGTPAQGGV